MATKNKVILCAFIIICTLGCGVNRPQYIHGYVYEYDKNRAIENVKVSFLFTPDTYIYTDSMGFFRFKFENFYPDLIFEKEGFRTDTIPTLWIFRNRSIARSFVNKYPDTIRLSKIIVETK